VAEGDWPQSKGVAILSFQSLREAELWKDSVPEIRQQDWLDGVDMIIAPVRSMPRTMITPVLLVHSLFYKLTQKTSASWPLAAKKLESIVTELWFYVPLDTK